MTLSPYHLKKLICIECPKGCRLVCKIRGKRLIKLSNNKCRKGANYAKEEIESPKRIVTTTIKANGLELYVLPVKTDKPIPKSKIFQVIKAAKLTTVSKPVYVGDIIVKNIIGLNANLIATRNVRKLRTKNIL